ncbi:Rho-related GTP-binding protein [Triplophysa tibetana]|uniref:Rho-related GTP-binding protein n=1 Tax=Triplophysa tibetana TaxID=1572043 RepID=A0A5A9N5L5_9TELE|nr:Rho-related GTP-binding protein [Triplophysa tibetana]
MTENRTIASNGTQIDELKIVVVGDGGCGKTSLLMVYAKDDFPEKYAPSVFDKYVATVNHGGKDIQLNLYDTAGQEDYDRLRPLSYQDVNLVLICYDVTNPTSFENVTIKWFPEVHHFCPNTPIILIGCKTDLRNNKEKMRKLKASDMAPITYLQGEEIQKQLKAEVYLECSAKYRENVEDIFRETAKRALAARAKAKHARRKKKGCSIL